MLEEDGLGFLGELGDGAMGGLVAVGLFEGGDLVSEIGGGEIPGGGLRPGRRPLCSGVARTWSSRWRSGVKKAWRRK